MTAHLSDTDLERYYLGLMPAVEVMLWHWRIALTVLIFSMSAGRAATAGGSRGVGQGRGEGSRPGAVPADCEWTS